MRRFEGFVRLASAADAELVAGSVRRAYGATYSPPFARADFVEREIAEGTVAYAVALSGERVAGHAALVRRGAAGLHELERASVHPGFRDQGVFGAVGAHLLEEVAPARGARFVIGRVVTTHLYAQRFGNAHGLRPIGLLLGMIPERVQASGFDRASQPISCLVYARRYESWPRPRRVALEGDDCERVLATLAALGIPARRGSARSSRPLCLASVESSAELGVATLRFGEAASGERLESVLAAHEGTRATWADVPIEHADGPAIVEELRAQGFTFASYLPLAGVAGEDVLRLQRFDGALERSAIVACEEASSIVEDVLAEARGAAVLA